MAKSKTEIDKELMYRKIMPSSSRPQPDRPESTVSAGAADSSSTPTSAGMADALRRSLTTPVQIRENRNAVLVNLMEELVLSRLDSTIQRFNCCRCDKCKKDIAALALNRLAPHYTVITGDLEEKQKEAEEKYASEVTGALVQAILVVKKEPRH